MEKMCRCGHDASHHLASSGPCLTCMCKVFTEPEPEVDLPDVSDDDIARAAADLLKSVSDLS